MADCIAVACAKSIDDFTSSYLPTTHNGRTIASPNPLHLFKLSLHAGPDLTQADFEACFKLVEGVKAEYVASSMGWKPKEKKAEMKLADMRYLLVKSAGLESEEQLVGFVSVMPTYEGEEKVLYVYEIHLEASFQGNGLGNCIMDLVDVMGKRMRVEKIMLTVFRTNKKASDWYQRRGFREDDCSPKTKKLRSGAVRQCEYIIMSKEIEIWVD